MKFLHLYSIGGVFVIEKIDCLGDFCPIPSIKVKQAYKNLKTGDMIIITCDHSCAPANIREVLKNNDCNIDIVEIADGIWEITIEKLD